MEDSGAHSGQTSMADGNVIAVDGPWSWGALFGPPAHPQLLESIQRVLVTRRWFGAKARAIRAISVVDVLAIGDDWRIALFEIHFSDGPTEVYQIPLGVAIGPRAAKWITNDGGSAWATLRVEGNESAVLYDAAVDPEFASALLWLFDGKPSAEGRLRVERAPTYSLARGDQDAVLQPRIGTAEQSNTSICYGEQMILKLYRRIERGTNPDWELNEFLASKGFKNIPPLAGALEYRPVNQQSRTLALMQGLVKNRGDAWQYLLQELGQGLHQLVNQSADSNVGGKGILLHVAASMVERLGQRTAELHLALGGPSNDSSFTPEPFTPAEQRTWAAEILGLAERTFELLASANASLRGDARTNVEALLDLRNEFDLAIKRFVERPIDAMRIRVHGDYHLGQVLVTDYDLTIIDFEGEPARPLDQRRRKQLALRDVAGMIRSLHYASRAAATHAAKSHPAQAESIDDWTAEWYRRSSEAFLATYRCKAGRADFLPASDDEFRAALSLCILEKAIYELQYELNNRPEWVYLPLGALLELLGKSE
jgi:trehalose synthase-fused probable maltokinase